MRTVVKAWILISALAVGSGWILSAFHELNRAGYVVVFALAAVAGIWWLRESKWSTGTTAARTARKFKKRFKRPAPLLFLTLLMMSLVAGAIYEPFNGDSQAYRIPRILHWLDAQQWHWIYTLDPRMNIIAPGFEWLSAPLILFTRDDRLLFLINVVSYAMLPGLIYSVFRRLGVAPRVAWWWMWILPSGWCFALQAGSVVNDCFVAIYALAAVDLALLAKEKGSVRDLWLSLLAAALVTGAKQCDIPLALLWIIAAWPALGLLRRHAIGTIFVGATGLLVSILPITIQNIRHTGNWLGAGIDPHLLQARSPFKGIIGNAFCIPLQNLTPPFDPWVNRWNALMDQFVATPFGHHFVVFEHFGELSNLSHSVGEGNAGIGLGICVFLSATLFAAWRVSKGAARPPRAGTMQQRLLLWAPWLLLLVFMARDLAYENARQLSPYYAFFLPVFLVKPGNAFLVRRRWWQLFGLVLMVFAAGLVFTVRSRPLFPAQAMVHWLHAKHPDSRLIARLEFTFDANPAAEELDRQIVNDLPPDEKLIGYATSSGSAETGLWLPLGQRRVQRLGPADAPETLRAEGIRYVVVDNDILKISNETIDQWMGKYHGELAAQVSCLIQPDLPPYYLYLVRLPP